MSYLPTQSVCWIQALFLFLRGVGVQMYMYGLQFLMKRHCNSIICGTCNDNKYYTLFYVVSTKLLFVSIKAYIAKKKKKVIRFCSFCDPHCPCCMCGHAWNISIFSNNISMLITVNGRRDWRSKYIVLVYLKTHTIVHSVAFAVLWNSWTTCLKRKKRSNSD